MIRRLPSLLASLAFFALLALAASHARADSEDGIVRVRSAVPVQEAIARIKADIAAKGIKFFSEIDQSKLAADAGINLRPLCPENLPECNNGGSHQPPVAGTEPVAPEGDRACN